MHCAHQFLLAICLMVVGCTAQSDPQIANCAKVVEKYVDRSSRTTIEPFDTYDGEVQYKILVCSYQILRPPAYFDEEFARGGANSAQMLARELEQTSYDASVWIIVRTFLLMKRQGTYDASKNEKLFKLISTKVHSMQSHMRRDDALHMVAELAHSAGSSSDYRNDLGNSQPTSSAR